MSSLLITDSEHAYQLIGCVRQYLADDQGEPDNRSDRIHDLATGLDDSVISYDDDGLSELANRLGDAFSATGEIELSVADNRDDLATIAAALSYVAGELRTEQTGYNFKPDSGLIEWLFFEVNPLLVDSANLD